MTEWFAQRSASPTTKPLELAQGHFVASTGLQRQQFQCGTSAEHLAAANEPWSLSRESVALHHAFNIAKPSEKSEYPLAHSAIGACDTAPHLMSDKSSDKSIR